MEYTYQCSWIIPFIPLSVPILIREELLFFPTATRNLRRLFERKKIKKKKLKDA